MRSGNIIVFDVETTGTHRRRDQVIELCVQFGVESDSKSRTWRIKPAVPISPGAQAVHGITMADLADCPPFAEYAEDIRAVFDEAQVLVGYNMSFDIEMLQSEYARLRAAPLDLRDKKFVDVFRLWQRCEPRSLQHAHQRFVGNSFEAAHSASADVAATGRVLCGMLDAFGLRGRDWGGIAHVCEPEQASWVGPSRHIRWAGDGVPVFGFGKHAGAPVHVLASSPESDYLRWIINRDFPRHVQAICRKALELSRGEFHNWAQRVFSYPGPRSTTDPRPPAPPSGERVAP